MEIAEVLAYLARWGHVVFGIAWIGLLYYFNFVQGAYMNAATDEAKVDAFTKLVPRALWWFRWAAAFTFLTGLYLLYVVMVGGRLSEDTLIAGLFGTLMAANVWFIIWPNQKIVIASNEAVARGDEADPNQGDAAAKALLASRTNVFFSLPMIFTMGSSFHFVQGQGVSTIGWGFVILVVLILIAEANAIFGKMNALIESVRAVIISSLVMTAIVWAVLALVSMPLM